LPVLEAGGASADPCIDDDGPWQGLAVPFLYPILALVVVKGIERPLTAFLLLH
jgi:hypothetical protein